MTRAQARESARDILEIIPLVMRTVAAELRAAGEMPAPAHFGLLAILCTQPRKLTDLASTQGVSLPSMSNSISAMAERGWVRRAAYAAVAARPRVLGALAVVLAVIVTATFLFLSTDVGQQASLDDNVRRMESFGRTVSDAQYAQMERMAPYSRYFAAGFQLIFM